jgi:hypothetical protein
VVLKQEFNQQAAFQISTRIFAIGVRWPNGRLRHLFALVYNIGKIHTQARPAPFCPVQSENQALDQPSASHSV